MEFKELNLDFFAFIKKNYRKIDFLAIQSLYENKEKDLLDELNKYQNIDGGFGHALEPDIRMPESSVACTAMAIKYLDQVLDENMKKDTIVKIVSFLEENYDHNKSRFFMTTRIVNNFPHPDWWDFNEYDDHFSYGNPDCEIVGFLYQYRKYLKKLNIDKLSREIINYIKSEEFFQGTMHTLISALYFYERTPQDIRIQIYEPLMHMIQNKVICNEEKWIKYCLEPYKIYVVSPDIAVDSIMCLDKNIAFIKKLVETHSVKSQLKWNKFVDVYEKIKDEWVGFYYFQMLKAIQTSSLYVI
jgi:hypothetical protein